MFCLRPNDVNGTNYAWNGLFHCGGIKKKGDFFPAQKAHDVCWEVWYMVPRPPPKNAGPFIFKNADCRKGTFFLS